jgi:hypothetical protein
MMWIIGQVGLVSGAIFGILLALGENGKPVASISLVRAALWESLSSAVFPVMTGGPTRCFGPDRLA